MNHPQIDSQTFVLSGQFSKFGSLLGFFWVPFGVLFLRAPYCIGDLQRLPNLENYPSEEQQTSFRSSARADVLGSPFRIGSSRILGLLSDPFGL